MTWCKKSLATLLLAAVLFVIGCVSNRPAPTVSQIARQRQEVETLVEEIDMIMREIEAVQHKASDKKYSTASQTRDLEVLPKIRTSGLNRKHTGNEPIETKQTDSPEVLRGV